jgi:hypothetical protein
MGQIQENRPNPTFPLFWYGQGANNVFLIFKWLKSEEVDDVLTLREILSMIKVLLEHSHVHIFTFGYGCFGATMAELRSWNRDCADCTDSGSLQYMFINPWS